MKAKKEGNLLVVRVDGGEELVESIEKACREHKVKTGIVSGIGAVSSCAMGVFNVEEKKYYKNEFSGALEITNLTGNVTTKDGQLYLHLHMTVGDDKGAAFGGHLNEAVVGVTAEVFILMFSMEVEREMDPNIGINTMVL